MSKTALVWVFKILGTLLISILLWACFLGTDTTIHVLSAVDSSGRGTATGPLYEKFMFGDDNSGFKAYLQEEWCNNSNNNGYRLAKYIESNWQTVEGSYGNAYVFKL